MDGEKDTENIFQKVLQVRRFSEKMLMWLRGRQSPLRLGRDKPAGLMRLTRSTLNTTRHIVWRARESGMKGTQQPIRNPTYHARQGG